MGGFVPSCIYFSVLRVDFEYISENSGVTESSCWKRQLKEQLLNDKKVKRKCSSLGEFALKGGEFSPVRGRISRLSDGSVRNM